MQSDPPTAKSIAQLVSQLIQFQEENLGKGVKNPPFLRLPVRKFVKLKGHLLLECQQTFTRFSLDSLFPGLYSGRSTMSYIGYNVPIQKRARMEAF